MEFQQFDEKKLSDTNDAWLSEATSLGMPTSEYELVLSWMKGHVNYQANHESLAYGIFVDGNTEADAIVDVVYTKRPGPDLGWIKMLSVWFSPKYSPAEIEKDSDRLTQVLDIYTEVIKGTILLTDIHTAKVIKLYGRDESLLTLLLALKERLASSSVFEGKLKAKMEGRWLVVSTN